MKVKKITKPELEGDTYLIAQAVNNNAEVLEGALNRIKELEKWLRKEEIAEKPIGFEGFIQSEDITNEEAINALKKFIDTYETCHVEEDTVAVSLNSEDVGAFRKAIEVLFHEPFKDAYIKQVVKERDIAIGQLDELGYSLGEKIRPCDKEPILEKVRAEMETQWKWLAEAGYDTYNVGIAFNSIRLVLSESEDEGCENERLDK